MTTTRDPAWLRKAMAPYLPAWRGPQSVRRYEPDSPESIFLAEQAARNGRTLKDSRALAERLADAAGRGLENEAAEAQQ
jgi:hypothetical protein